MSDFTLPKDDDVRRGLLIASYEQRIAEATSLAKLNEDVSAPEERVIVCAREANRMAFELFMAGVYVEDEWKKKIEPFVKYLPTRPYERRIAPLQTLADQMETVTK